MTTTFDPLAARGADPDMATAILATGVLTEAVRHGEDLAAIAQTGAGRWTDALLSEVRSHIAGCLNTIELAIRVELAGHPIEQALDALGEGICRRTLDNALSLLSAPLIDHFRLRAAAALALRMGQDIPPPSAFALSAEGDGSLTGLDQQPAGDALTALALSIDPWHEPHAEARPMRADLPAETYCELAWVAATLLLDSLDRSGVDSAAATGPVVNAVEAVTARHDEQHGPFARAAFAAGSVPDDRAADVARAAVLGRNLLLTGALAARATRLTMDAALAILTDGDEAERAALARALGCDDDVYLALLTMLSPLRGGLSDAWLAERIADYRQLTGDAALATLARRRGPEALVSRRLRLDRTRR